MNICSHGLHYEHVCNDCVSEAVQRESAARRELYERMKQVGRKTANTDEVCVPIDLWRDVFRYVEG